MLEIEDVWRLAKSFPIEASDGSPNWAIAGGGAVKFLIEGKAAERAKCDHGSESLTREHKDLDIVAFNPNASRFRIRHPHEIFRTFWRGKLQRLDYRSLAGEYAGFFIEILNRRYFGFQAPIRDNLVKVICEDRVVWTLSPEYIVASKFFSLLPIRSVDLADVRVVASHYELDMDRIYALVAQSELSFLDRETVRVVVETGDVASLETAIEAEAVRRHSFLGLTQSKPPAMRALLSLDPNDFMLDHLIFARRLADRLVMHIKGRDNGEDTLWLLTFAVFLCQRPMSEKFISAIQGIPLGWPSHIPVLFVRGLLDLQKALSNISLQHLFDLALPHLIYRFLLTPYVHVILAEIDATTRQIRNATHVSYAERAIFRLVRFMSQTGKWEDWT